MECQSYWGRYLLGRSKCSSVNDINIILIKVKYHCLVETVKSVFEPTKYIHTSY